MLRNLLIFLLFLQPKADPMTVADSLVTAAMDQLHAGNYAESIAIGREALDVLGGADQEMSADIYSAMCNAYARLGDFDNAIECNDKCYEYDIATDNKEGLSSDLNNLASIYQLSNQPELAEPYILEAIAIERELNESLRRGTQLAIRLGKASEIYYNLGKYETALEYAKEAYEIDVRGERKENAAVRQCQVANCKVALGMRRESIADLNAAKAVLEESSNRNSLAICLMQLGEGEIAVGRTGVGLDYLRRAASISEECENNTLTLRIYKRLCKTLQNVNPREACSYYELESALRDSLYHAQTNDLTSRYNVEFQTREKEQTIALQSEKLKYQKYEIIFIAAFTLLLAMLAVTLVLFYRQRVRDNRNLKRLNKLKDRFFSIISHDLRSPAIAQRAAAKMLYDNYSLLSPDELHLVCEDLVKSSESNVELIQNLLQWARLQAGDYYKVVPVRFNAARTFSEVIDVYGPIAQKKGVELRLEADDELILYTDRNLILTVARNLVSNAIKFTPDGGNILLSINTAGDGVAMSVKDTGVGMDQETMDSLFSLDKSVSKLGTNMETGNGLGLIIAREMTELCGGTLTVTSRVGDGTTFTAMLPPSAKA